VGGVSKRFMSLMPFSNIIPLLSPVSTNTLEPAGLAVDAVATEDDATSGLQDEVSIPESRSDPELLEQLASSDMPDEVLLVSDAIRPRSQRARNRLGVFLNERTVTVKLLSASDDDDDL